MMKNARDWTVFNTCTGIGIDVAKTSLEVVGIADEQVCRATVSNHEADIETLAKTLQAGGYTGKVVCEATGHYHLLLGLVMARYGLDLRVINPLQSSKHRRARVRKTKTDAVDGHVLASMCETERALPAAAELTPQKVLIRLKQGQLQALDKQLQRLSRSLAVYTETYAQLGLVAGASHEALAQVVADLKRIRGHLEKELQVLLEEALPAREDLRRLQRIPGFSPLVAGLVGTAFHRHAASARAWVAYAGLDVSVRQSGTWRGRGKLTKRGNRYLRKRLYNAAWGAMMNDEGVRRYYLSLKETGRNHVEALCIIARKLLSIAYAVLVKGKEYDSSIAFAQ